MATTKITHKELEELVKEMVNKMINELPGEAPIMEKKSKEKEHHMSAAQKRKREEIIMAMKKKMGKKEFEKKKDILYPTATKNAMKSVDEKVDAEYTKKYNNNPFLKGKQKTDLPDDMQDMIIKSKGGKSQEDIDERNMSFSWERSAANRDKKRMHYLDEEKIKELEERKRAIMKKLEELDFGGPETEEEIETEVDTETEDQPLFPPPTRPGRPNPFRRRESDTEVIPDMEPQGRLEDAVRRYMKLRK